MEYCLLTVKEWLTLIANMRLSCNNRIISVNSGLDEESFSLLMDLAPDMSRDDDGAFVITQLRRSAIRTSGGMSPNYRCIASYPSEYMDGCYDHMAGIIQRTIAMDDVLAFIPLTERGATILRSDARRASVRLSEPIYEKLWDTWVAAHRKSDAARKGIALAQAYGLPAPDYREFSEILPFLLFDDKFQNADAVRKKYLGTLTYPLTMTFGVLRVLVCDDRKFEAFRDKINLKDFASGNAQNFSVNFDTNQITKDKSFTDIFKKIDEFILKELKYRDISIYTIFLTFHYISLLIDDKAIDIACLERDIDFLLSNASANQAAIAVSVIGGFMESEAVATIVYRKSPQRSNVLVYEDTAPPHMPDSPDSSECDEITEDTKKPEGNRKTKRK
ncbi:MAG: hypothetical protein LBR22_11355 [Desulfovibrio sp.]|jgi:hypothetical protein|nr:hypothetical protein [Desulfovibrio sp.]